MADPSPTSVMADKGDLVEQELMLFLKQIFVQVVVATKTIALSHVN
jgi:hypothetical protein